MSRFDAETAQCTIFTYKEGLLSPIAHDLQIAVTRFSVTVTPAGAAFALRAEFDATSLRVLSAMRDGAPAPQLLSDTDKRKIEHNIVADVLEARIYPQIVFVANEVKPGPEPDAASLPIVGQLTLHGRTRELRCTARRIDDRHVAEVTLHQPDYAIKPYSALLGTLRIAPDVRVRLSLPRVTAGS